MRAKDSDLMTRSAEKDRRKGKTPGPIGCSPESIIAKQNQAYANLEDPPDMGPDLANRKSIGQYRQPRNTNTLT